MSRAHLLKISVSGIRGVVGDFLTPNLAGAFAHAFGTYVGPGRVVLGRDTRATGEMLEHAVCCGLMAAGCEVIKVGILPTPTIQIYVSETQARGGLAITASHNPPEYNALKLFNADGLFFNHYERTELLDLYHQSAFRRATNLEMRPLRTDYETAPKRHFQRVLQFVNVPRIRDHRFRVALDGVNGAGSVMSVNFLRDQLGCELYAMSVDPDKPFPREAEPRPEVLGELRQLVLSTESAIGFAQDPDGDRLAICEETGHVLDNDDVLALVVDCVLRRKKGPVVVNLTTSSAVDDIAGRYGCPVYRTPVGEANVVERMKSTKAVIGGEGSNGGIIFPAVQYCRDSYTGMAFVLDRLAESGQTLSQLATTLPKYHRLLDKSGFRHGRLGPLMQALQRKYPAATVDRSDGLKLSFKDAWIHVRASNTEPLLRYAVESRSRDKLTELGAEVRLLVEREGN